MAAQTRKGVRAAEFLSRASPIDSTRYYLLKVLLLLNSAMDLVNLWEKLQVQLEHSNTESQALGSLCQICYQA